MKMLCIAALWILPLAAREPLAQRIVKHRIGGLVIELSEDNRILLG